MMYHKDIFKLLSLTVALLLSGCAADEYGEQTTGKVAIRLTATSVPSSLTRAGTSVQSQSFEADEQINAYIQDSENNWIGNPTVLTTVTPVSNVNALNPDEWPYFPSDDSKTISIYALYPSTVTRSTTSFTVASDQRAENGDATSNVDATRSYKGSDLMHASVSNVAKTTDAIPLTFTHKMAKLIVQFQSGGGPTVTGVTVKGVARTIGFTPSTGALGATSNSGDISMSNNGACLIPPQTKAASDFLVVSTTEGNITFTLDEAKTFASGAVYTMVLTAGEEGISQTVAITGWTANGYAIVAEPTSTAEPPANAEAVDLGLPSGLKWANMNVGANTETDYGTYFAWGEIHGYSDENNYYKKFYDPKNYRWCHAAINKLHRYCPKSLRANYWYNPSTYSASSNPLVLECMVNADNLGILLFSDDAARFNWGGEWRMPTKQDIEELLAETNQEWITDYNGTGINGVKFTNKSDATKYIFLLAGGERYANVNPRNVGAETHYWSSSLYPTNPSYAYTLKILSSGNSLQNNKYRYEGRLVRPVLGPRTYRSLSSVTPNDVGMTICANGHLHETVIEAVGNGCVASGIIAYVNENAEARTDCPDISGSYRGLALSVENVSTSSLKWFTANTDSCTEQSADLATVLTWYDGVAKTSALADGHNDHEHAAASACKNFATPRPEGASGWFMPSAGQWNIMAKALSTKGGQTAVPDFTTSSNSKLSSTNLNKCITAACGISLSSHWCSSEKSAAQAWYMTSGGSMTGYNKSSTWTTRACFAF